ncbi:DUF4382 domain-containing protein [Chitinophaga lutea]|uniref:DUF4382 domain-containing protein n=1 Tax=Chitinophaga lutea TaxID=2488634 RepID=A0A3N4PCE7_9BACT|nr:DUF4382 domain-containing protein [Chitinophaga lutea]RPE05896.1 DUF4382 domain-containing protein [Chitinophaga lutea]
MKKVFRKWGLPVVLLGALSFIMYACTKNSSAEPGEVPDGKQRVSIKLTDGPGVFDQVLIDIRKVEVLIDTCKSDDDDDDDRWDDRDRCGWWEDRGRGRDKDDDCDIWDSLAVKPGVYDLLKLRNGVDTSLAAGVIAKGRIKAIRITVGPNNSLVKDSVSYPLRSIGGQVKILIKVRHHEWDEISPDNLQLWLDFDIQRSIIQVSRGKFILVPFIHVWTLKTTGSVSGRILPTDAEAVVTVYNSLDSMYALPGRQGEFKIRGLKVGTYSLYVNAGNGYRDTTITNIKVERNKDTKVPTITLKK